MTFTSPQSLHKMNSVVCILQIECTLFPGVAWQLLSVAFSFTSARILPLAVCLNPPRKWLSTQSLSHVQDNKNWNWFLKFKVVISRFSRCTTDFIALSHQTSIKTSFFKTSLVLYFIPMSTIYFAEYLGITGFLKCWFLSDFPFCCQDDMPKPQAPRPAGGAPNPPRAWKPSACFAIVWAFGLILFWV